MTATATATAGATVVIDDAESAPARRGRQRSTAADEAILTATLEELAVTGYGGLTMAAVIARAKVSSATLYRRWPTKQTLVAAALASLHAEIVDIDTGTLEGDIAAHVDSVSAALSIRRDDLAEHVALALQRYPEFRTALNEKFMTPRLEVLERAIKRARVRGELGCGLTAEVAYSIVSGPVHHRVTVLGKPVGPSMRRTYTRAALAALQAIAPLEP